MTAPDNTSQPDAQPADVERRPPTDAGNPCPFLRGLVAHDEIDGDREPLWSLATKVATTMNNGPFAAPPAIQIAAIALLGSAKSPRRFATAIAKGVDVGSLRYGPLDKRGGGSRAIDAGGIVSEQQLARIAEFASEHLDERGHPEAGLDADELVSMMDANFERPTQRRRRIDRSLMDGEWPALLEVMGKTHGPNPYLALDEVNDLIRNRRLPQRVLQRLR